MMTKNSAVVAICKSNAEAEAGAKELQHSCFDMKKSTMKRMLLLCVGAVLWPFLTPALLEAQLQTKQMAPVDIKVFKTSDLPQALVLAVHGRCDYSEDGTTFTKLRAGHVFKQGDVVRTGAEARTDLFFRRIGTTVRLQGDTEIKLEKMARHMKDGLPVMETLLDLRTGRIFTVVRSLVPGSTFEIRNAAGRSVVEGGGGKGRYIITADGTHVTDKDSIVPLKVIGERGITVIAPGQKFLAKYGKLFGLATPKAVELLIDFDELDSLAEQLTASLAPQARPKAQDDAQALVLAVGEHSTYSQHGKVFKKLKVGQVLTEGAVLRTGDDTMVDLFLRRWGTTVRLTSNTELGLEKMVQNVRKQVLVMETRLHLRKGRIFCFIRIPVADAKFEVRTALGRSLLESAGAGRYDIRADGTIVAGKSSFDQLKVITEHGVTTIAPGQKFTAENGHVIPTAPSEMELLVIQMDELVSLAEELTPTLPPEDLPLHP